MTAKRFLGRCLHHYMSCARWVFLGFCAVLISACVAPSGKQPEPVGRSVDAREALLHAIQSYQFSGGLGIWTEQQSISARINWSQTAEAFQVEFGGPLGMGDMELTHSGGLANLQRGDVSLASGPSVDQVLQSGLGLAAPVPMEQLQLWVRGLPGDAVSVQRDAQGKLLSLQYTDATGLRWQARFKRYVQLQEDNIAVPALITASGGPYSVRLVLKNWQVATISAVPELHESNKRLAIPSR